MSWGSRVTRRLEKKDCQIFQKIAQKVAKSKKAKNIYNKAQFESSKHLQQTTFETLKVAQWRKIAQSGHPVNFQDHSYYKSVGWFFIVTD